MDYSYSRQIYQLLQQYLPGISTSLSNIDKVLSDLSSALVPDLQDIRKFLLWLLIAFLSTKLIRWEYRV